METKVLRFAGGSCQVETSEDPWGGIRRDSGAGGLLYKDSNETNGRFCCAQHDTAQHRHY